MGLGERLKQSGKKGADTPSRFACTYDPLCKRIGRCTLEAIRRVERTSSNIEDPQNVDREFRAQAKKYNCSNVR